MGFLPPINFPRIDFVELKRDLLFFGGLGMLFYGLYQAKPWIAYTVVGSIIFLISLVSVVNWEMFRKQPRR